MVAEGMLALTGQHFIIDYNEKAGTLPGFVAGFTLVARDEHRHVAFGARFLRDMVRRDERHAAAIQRALVAVAPAADGVLRPKWFEGSDEEAALLGVSVAETRAFALTALERRLKAIGLGGRRLDISRLPLVAPSHRPTLREELAGMPRRTRIAAIVVLAAIVLGAAFLLATGTDARTARTSCARSRSRSTCATRTRCREITPAPGEWLHLERQDRDSFVVAPLELPAYEGDVGGVLPIVGRARAGGAQGALPGPRAGRGGQGAHQQGRGLLARLPRRSRAAAVRPARAAPAAARRGTRDGVKLLLLANPDAGADKARDVGTRGLLKTPYRSFRFGTEGP